MMAPSLSVIRWWMMEMRGLRNITSSLAGVRMNMGWWRRYWQVSRWASGLGWKAVYTTRVTLVTAYGSTWKVQTPGNTTSNQFYAGKSGQLSILGKLWLWHISFSWLPCVWTKMCYISVVSFFLMYKYWLLSISKNTIVNFCPHYIQHNWTTVTLKTCNVMYVINKQMNRKDVSV